MTDTASALLPWLVILPLAWAVTTLLLGPGRGARLAIATSAAQLALALLLAARLPETGVQSHLIGGWNTPLGIALRADGLATVMLVLTQAVALPMLLYARAYYREGAAEARYFWPLAGFLFAGLNALFLSADLFNIYVSLELAGLAAVGLVAAGGGSTQVAAALRYLFAALGGSMAYLLGVALVYGAMGTVSLDLLEMPSAGVAPLALAIAGLLMLLGLMLKAALFPFHGWLPSAHGGAPAPVSALLSALVVKAAFYLVLRLWSGPFAALGEMIAWLPALLGAAAIGWGSVQAIRARRIKMLVAYSTVAQIGYLFLIFPLLGNDAVAREAGIMHAVAHGLAKAAMFAAAGVLIRATGQHYIAGLAGTASRLPLTLFAFGLAGVSLMGLPPSAGFLAKWLLIEAALARGHWLLVAVVLAGGLLAAVYVFRVLRQAFIETGTPVALAPVPRVLEWCALVLAASSVLLGLRGVEILQLLAVGNSP
jgi:multicomponent Na+:H+ antiporter subunit D